jgi:hypothetical protein
MSQRLQKLARMCRAGKPDSDESTMDRDSRRAAGKRRTSKAAVERIREMAGGE